MSFERARAVADAVLLEGYALYPYRASAPKNRFRWTFGVLAPRAWSEAGGCERWWMEAQLLLEPLGGALEVEVRLRFLHPRLRRVEEATGGGGFREVAALEAGGRLYLPWEEGDLREIDHDLGLGRAAAEAGSPERAVNFEVPGCTACEPIRGPAGEELGRVVHAQSALRGRVLVAGQTVPAERPLLRLRVRVENETPWDRPTARRDDALRASCVAAHLLVAARGGAFVSLLDPPDWARAAAGTCRSAGVYPVLAGESGQRDLVLAAPIILYDHPRVAPESPGDSFDATEIDELLALRTATLTDEEKREARATDPRAAAVVDRAERMPPELLRRLHGAARAVQGGEMAPLSQPTPGGKEAGWAPGARVRLRPPGPRRTDAQDVLYAGRAATVQRVERDVDGTVLLAVSIDDDPAAELHQWYGRHRYYHVDEVDLLAPGGEP